MKTDQKKRELEIRALIDAARNADPTGGMLIADCLHGFPNIMLVRLADKKTWRMVIWETCKCIYCADTQNNMRSFTVTNCPICGAKLAAANTRTRSYVIGSNDLADYHLAQMGFIIPPQAVLAAVGAQT